MYDLGAAPVRSVRDPAARLNSSRFFCHLHGVGQTLALHALGHDPAPITPFIPVIESPDKIDRRVRLAKKSLAFSDKLRM